MPTYAEIRERAKGAAKCLIDESCDFKSAMNENTYDSWETYLESLDAFDVYDAAHMEADSWDVVIYSGKALDLINNTWQSEIDRAEESMQDTGFEFQDFAQTCTVLAYWIVYHALTEALEAYVDDMRDLASNMQDNAKEVEV